VRLLSIETSTRRGSVALASQGRILATREHEEPSAHAERILGLIEQALAELGWTRASLDRVAVGVGPGSFTGLRVGIALAQGIALGLDRPLVGIGSLRAMASAVPADDARPRVSVLDARRSELFVAAYASDGREAFPPSALPAAEARRELTTAFAGQAPVLVGEFAGSLGVDWPILRGPTLDLPHASAVATLGMLADPAQAKPEPVYVRGPGATLPNLPPSPLG
jgi:tRNA threonylcarbamoyladenosine biosynthesis protein TsaB